MSIGFVINVVVKPASTPDTLCKNKSEVFIEQRFSNCSEKYIKTTTLYNNTILSNVLAYLNY